MGSLRRGSHVRVDEAERRRHRLRGDPGRDRSHVHGDERPARDVRLRPGHRDAEPATAAPSTTPTASRSGRAAPTLASPLTITGIGVAGTSLNATHGAITPAGDWSPSYTWVVGGVPQDTMWGGLSPLALTSAMVGQRITLRMSAYLDGAIAPGVRHRPGRAGRHRSGTTPTVTGTAKVGIDADGERGHVGPDSGHPGLPVVPRGRRPISGATATDVRADGQQTSAKTMTVKVTGSKASVRHDGEDVCGHDGGRRGTLTAADADDQRHQGRRLHADGRPRDVGPGAGDAGLPVVPLRASRSPAPRRARTS